MNITYCRKCNHFSFSKRISNYCKGCKLPTIPVDMKFEEFSVLSVNERYKLAYKLTTEYDNTFKSQKQP